MAECMELSGQMIMPEPFDLDCGLPKQVKEETFTENGSYEIMPDKGFQLDKAKVNVDVFVPEEQEKVLEVEKNGSYKVLPDELKVLSKVSVNVTTPEQKPETTFGIGYDKNGKYLIRPQEGYVFTEGMVEVNVPSQIDLTQIGFTEVQNQQYNEPFLNGIEYAKAIKEDNPKPTTLNYKFKNDKKLIYFGDVDLSLCIGMVDAFANSNIEAFEPSNLLMCEKMNSAFYNCLNLKIMPEILDVPNVSNLDYTFTNCKFRKLRLKTTSKLKSLSQTFSTNKILEELIIDNIENVERFFVTFAQLVSIRLLHFFKWKKGDIDLSTSGVLEMESIRFNIDQALTAPENVRKLTLNSAVGKLFEQEPDFTAYRDLASSKGITIQW